MGTGIPTFRDNRRSRIDSVVSFVIERNSLEPIFLFFDIGARSDFVIFEEY